MRRILMVSTGLLTLLAAAQSGAQSAYPEKAVRIVVGFPAGSGVDVVARVFGQRLGEALGTAIVIENVPGAAGNIASERVARAAPDGYALALASQGQIVINPMLYKLSFDPVKDLAPVSLVYLSSNVLVVQTGLRVKSVQELLHLARTRPGELTFATGGSGSSPHLAGTLFKSMAGIDIREIPYKGVNAAIPDVLGGRVTMMFSPIAEVLSLVRENKLRGLAVTSARRSPAFPELPTINESGLHGFDASSWGGLLAPAGTPARTIGKIQQDTAKALAHPDVRARLAEFGITTSGNSPEEFTAMIKAEVPRWAKVFKEAGIGGEQ